MPRIVPPCANPFPLQTYIFCLCPVCRDAKSKLFLKHSMNRYFLYARKSSEAEERQIMSIDAQIDELKEFATKEKLTIVASFEEAKTAKEPGRTVFGEMIARIEAGEADGILAWHPDRLARNSVDGGRIIYMVDTHKINSLKFPQFWFDNTPQGKFMLSIAFGQSKYYVDNLSENVKRGIRQKLRKGIWPGKAPFGYTNDLRNHAILPDPDKYKLVKRIFELYATGEYTLEQIVTKFNLRTKTDKLCTAGDMQHILKNPFYYGVFRFKGEIHQGTHKPIITKKLFDQAQTVMAVRSKRRRKGSHNYIFTGFMSCGSCTRAITAERQKGHVYYRCTKKRTDCNEKYVREEDLLLQFKDTLQKVSLPDSITDQLLAKLNEEQETKLQSSSALADALEGQIMPIKAKLERLLDSHLEGTVDKETYLAIKEKLLNEKLNLEAKMKVIRTEGADWLEPMREFIVDSKQAKKIAREDDLIAIRTFLKKIGSNFMVKGKKCTFVAERGWRTVEQSVAYVTVQARSDSNREPRFWRPLFYH